MTDDQTGRHSADGPVGGVAAGPSGPMATVGPVHIVGTGLLGTSIGVALSRSGISVTLEDISPLALAVAAELGAGRVPPPGVQPPALVVVAVPPEVTVAEVRRQLTAWPQAVVTDVASVKSSIIDQLSAAGVDLGRYVGSHPMAGREKSGAAAAMADLFIGRPWVIVPTELTSATAILAVRALAVDLGAQVVQMPARAHDAAVALVSHMPQVVASAVARRLPEGPAAALDLAGQGLRDVTRIAASDPALWASILVANASAVAGQVRAVIGDLETAAIALEAAAAGQLGKGVAAIHQLVAAGNAGVSAIPGKHGGARADFDVVTVLVPDQPGQLGRLFTTIGAIGVNLEDVHIEHAGGKPVGLTEVSVLPGSGARLAAGLAAGGWRILG